MIDLSEALERVEVAQSLDELRAIAKSLSAEAIGLGGIFYSHEIDPTTKSGALAHSLAKTLGVPILDNTPGTSQVLFRRLEQFKHLNRPHCGVRARMLLTGF